MVPLAVGLPWKPGPYQEAMPVWIKRGSGGDGSLTIDGGMEQAARKSKGRRKNKQRHERSAGRSRDDGNGSVIDGKIISKSIERKKSSAAVRAMIPPTPPRPGSRLLRGRGLAGVRCAE